MTIEANHRIGTLRWQLIRPVWIAGAALAVAGCGQSEFTTQMAAICAEPGGDGLPRNSLPGFSGRDCGCVVSILEDGLTPRQQATFIPLRYELRPDPQDRERVNGQTLRAAGIDPTDRQAVRSARSELDDALHPLNERIRSECPTAG